MVGTNYHGTMAPFTVCSVESFVNAFLEIRLPRFDPQYPGRASAPLSILEQNNMNGIFTGVTTFSIPSNIESLCTLAA